ncbi:type II toxin-antitoxin system VapC family toxin [Candidatus Infernicultor aquiphilus]|uniref:type II toxin-antitoxin system VapC family toxin n=1 Tax=Candidatus Infernicultor aquiphilus TaxID=1805029 RepID=UPI00269D9AA5
MKEDKEIFILDTSALLTFIEDEEGSEYIENLLIRAEKGDVAIYVAFISLTEVFYITAKGKDESEALKRVKLIQSLAVRVEESNENLNVRAGAIKAKNRISIADAYIAALCQEHNGILVHKDPEFEKISPTVKEFRLPYKIH